MENYHNAMTGELMVATEFKIQTFEPFWFTLHPFIIAGISSIYQY